MPKPAKQQHNIFEGEKGRAVMANFEQQMWEFALQETEFGKQARLALRLRSDKARQKEARRAIKPFMTAYVNLLMAPAEKLEKGAAGKLCYPVVLPRPRRKVAQPA